MGKARNQSSKWKIVRRRFQQVDSAPDMWQLEGEDNPKQVARFFKNETPLFEPGYYIGRLQWGGWLGPLPSLKVAKDAALFLDDEQSPNVILWRNNT